MKNKKPIKKKIIKSKKPIKKVKIPKELKKYKPICVPYSKLNKKDRLSIDSNKPWGFYEYSTSILEKTKDPVLTPEQFEKAIKDSGQITDREVVELPTEEKQRIKEASFKKSSFAKLIRNDIELSEMMGWLTDVITGGVQNMSFDTILKKFSEFYINKLNVSELLHMRYTLDDKIKEMIMGKDKYNEGGEDIFRAVQG